MGFARWDSTDWSDYASSTSGRSREDVFARRSLDPDFDPRRIDMRESRDSDLNPQSNAIIIAFDETGSMGSIPDAFVREGLGTLVEEILNRRPVSDPHVMIMGLGDAWCDSAPLQVTQFEADIRIAEQLTRLWLEGGGGGNRFESYNLPWYFAACHTAIDCFEKRGHKGYLFTVGDEPPPPALLAAHVREVCGDALPRDLSTREVLAAAQRMYEVFHVVVEQGSYYRSDRGTVRRGWEALLGQRVLYLADYRRLAELIVSAIAVNEGSDAASVAGSWRGETAEVVARGLARLAPPEPPTRRSGWRNLFGGR